MKTFVQYGAGNIGRGFIGALFAKAGYAVQFVDVNMTVIDALNELHQYPVEIVSNAGNRDEIITNVSGVDGRDANAVIEAIANADAMATAVGVNIMPRIVPLITSGLKRRWENGNLTPFNIIICENLLDADKLMHKLICEQLTDDEKKTFESCVGLVEASIGRMVPVMTDEMRRGDILRVCVEEYCQLPVDAAAWKGELPNIPSLFPYSPFAFFIRRKLFIHNMGHATSAYLGCLKGVDYIWQSVSDPCVKVIAERAMRESAMALAAEFDYPLDKLIEHIDDLLLRFGNVALGDTVARVGRDTKRKLGASDRFAGALKLCDEKGMDNVYIALGAAAALFFKSENDEGTDYVKNMLAEQGLDAVLTNHMGLDANANSAKYIKAYYKLFAEGADLAAVLECAQAFKASILTPKKIV
ncbi:MAG: mannitol dehydrogenase [Ruminococcaceae bacterium]|nr:mannitol dehydrogenase [Oscillospiraceae bacterium]